MLAVDTNFVVRYLVRDDLGQFAKVRGIVDSEKIYVLSTVALETEWVLRRSYKFASSEIRTALTAFAGLANVEVEKAEKFAKALEWMADGLDFADALHLANAGECDAFLTFDRDLASRAARIDSKPVRLL